MRDSTAGTSETLGGDALSIIWQFFGPLPQTYRKLLTPALERIALAPGERLIQQNEPGDTLFILLTGRLRVIDEELEEPERVLAFKEPGEGVGEISFLTGERRTASVDAVTKAELVSLSRQGLESAAAAEARQVIYQAIGRRVHQSRLNHVLIKTHVFKGVEEAVLRDIQAELELMTVTSGETLIEAGDPGDALFIVIGGRLRVVGRRADGEETRGVDIHRGQTIGGVGLITGETMSERVFAVRDSLLGKLSQDAFQRLLQKHPGAMLTHFAGPIITNLREQLVKGESITDRVTTLCVVPVDDAVPLPEFTVDLATALSAIGSTMHLNGPRCAALLGSPDVAYLADDDPQNERFIFWLNEQEAAHEFVVYEADLEPTAWTRRCVRQADLVLIVGDARRSPELGVIEQSVLATAENHNVVRCLVLLHDEESPLPVGSARWLAQRTLRSHYHVRARQKADYSRLARLLAGRGVGLVLSGGGARAMAQIGVLRALTEQGVPIDAICGTSGGAVIAGLFAMGLDFETMISRISTSVDRVDYTLPLHALTTGKNFTRALAFLFGATEIEDLWTPYFCISANLTHAGLMRHASGSLMHAVRASTAIPGILPPAFQDGNILADGGLINNLPTDLMNARPDVGVIIAIDVTPSAQAKPLTPFDYSISGWRSLWRRLIPWARKAAFPSIAEVMMRSITIANAQTIIGARGLVDLYLVPPVQYFGLLEFSKVRLLADIGHNYASERVAAWLREREVGW